MSGCGAGWLKISTTYPLAIDISASNWNAMSQKVLEKRNNRGLVGSAWRSAQVSFDFRAQEKYILLSNHTMCEWAQAKQQQSCQKGKVKVVLYYHHH